jgi:hypothetical protein
LAANSSLFGWLVADGWCWFLLREENCWLVAGGCFVLREKYCWLVADKPSEQGVPKTNLETLAPCSFLLNVCLFCSSSLSTKDTPSKTII